MRLVTGALLLLAAEQAYAHAHLVQFPHYRTASPVLLPASAVFAVLGVGFLVWGALTDGRK